MAAQLDVTKIDSFVEEGVLPATESTSTIHSFVMEGVRAATMSVTKIDSFTMISLTPPPPPPGPPPPPPPVTFRLNPTSWIGRTGIT